MICKYIQLASGGDRRKYRYVFPHLNKKAGKTVYLLLFPALGG